MGFGWNHSTMKSSDRNSTPSPILGLVRADKAARTAGLSEQIFCSACDQGEIPIRLVRLGGKQTRYVRLAELQSFLGVQPK